MKKIILSALIVVFCFSSTIKVDAAFFAPNDPGVNIGMNLAPGFEPSGIFWHNRLHTLFVVWDNGFVAEMDSQGNVIHQSERINADLEGVTIVDHQSNLIYLLVEFPQQILEYDISTWSLTGKHWELQGMQGNDSSGAEALTYNSDLNVFYVGSQFDGQIYVYNIDLNTLGSVNFSSIIRTGVNTDLAGLSFSDATHITYAVFDRPNIIQEYNNANQLVQQYDAPGDDQEGIALIPNCPADTASLVIAQDSGGVLRFDTYPVQCPDNPVAVAPAPAQPFVPVLIPPIVIKYTSNSMHAGPGTRVENGYHIYDAKNEYSSMKIQPVSRPVYYRIDLEARASSLDTQYPLAITLKSALGAYTSEGQRIDSLNWKRYSYYVLIPPNTFVQLYTVSSVMAGRSLGGVVREHDLRSVTITEVRNQQIRVNPAR